MPVLFFVLVTLFVKKGFELYVASTRLSYQSSAGLAILVRGLMVFEFWRRRARVNRQIAICVLPSVRVDLAVRLQLPTSRPLSFFHIGGSCPRRKRDNGD